MQAYTLRTAAVAALMLAPAIAHAQPATAARRAAAARDARCGHRLSLADVRRYGAAMQEIGLALGADPALADRFTGDGGESVEQIAARLGGVAEFRRAFARTGITPRRFALTQLTFLGAGLALGAPASGQTTERPAAQMDIDQENVAFVRANRAAIEATLRELGARVGDHASDRTDIDASTR